MTEALDLANALTRLCGRYTDKQLGPILLQRTPHRSTREKVDTVGLIYPSHGVFAKQKLTARGITIPVNYVQRLSSTRTLWERLYATILESPNSLPGRSFTVQQKNDLRDAIVTTNPRYITHPVMYIRPKSEKLRFGLDIIPIPTQFILDFYHEKTLTAQRLYDLTVLRR